MNKILFTLHIMGLILMNTLLQAQTITIFGNISDKNTGEKLPYVNIGVENTSIGTISNEKGDFVLAVPEKHKAQNFVVSMVGYESQKFSVEKNTGKATLTVKLVSIDFNISEVKVVDKSMFAYKIVKTAAEKIKDNYLQGPYNYKSYYRTHQTGYKKRFRESVLLVYDANGYAPLNTGLKFTNRNYSISEVRRDYTITDMADALTHVDEILQFDVAYSYLNIFNVNANKDFEISIKSETVLNSDSVWVIAFNCKNLHLITTGVSQPLLYKGELYISKSDYAILKVNGELEYRNYSTAALSVAANQTPHDIANFMYTTTYKKSNSHYALNTINMLKQVYNNNKVFEWEQSYYFEVQEIITSNYKKIDGREYLEKKAENKLFWSSYKSPPME